MPISPAVFNSAGNAVGDLFAAEGLKSQAAGYKIQAGNYRQAAAQADKEADMVRASTEIRDFQTSRKIYGVVSSAEAAIAGSNLSMSGSALDILRDSAAQGSLERSVGIYQGRVSEEGLETQAASYRAQAQAADKAAKAAKRAVVGKYVSAAIGVAGAVAGAM